MTHSAPADGLGDGTTATAVSIDVDVTSLSQHDASEYRRELLHAIYHPGSEFDTAGAQYEADLAAYYKKVAEIDLYLDTFPEKI